jgi:hypothetical protein
VNQVVKLNNFNRRLDKLEAFAVHKETKYLVRHEHIDYQGSLKRVVLPEGFNSIEEAEAAFKDKFITWIVVRHVEQVGYAD